MKYERGSRLAERIKERVAQVVLFELHDPRIGFVTVTDVETTGDLQQARVYVSLLGDDDERQRSLDGLNSAHGVLQRRVAEQLRLKRTPTLTFFEDPTARRAARVDELLADPDLQP